MTSIAAAQMLPDTCSEMEVNKAHEEMKNIDQQTINGPTSDRQTRLHGRSAQGNDQMVPLVIEPGGCPFIRDAHHGSVRYEETRLTSAEGPFGRFIDGDDYLEIRWACAYRDPIEKCTYLREKLLEILFDKDRGDERVFEDLGSNMEYVLNCLPLLHSEKNRIEEYFCRLRKTWEPTEIIKCYSSTTSFHRHWNAWLPKSGIEFFEPDIVDIHADYRMIKTLLQLAAILMHHDRFFEYRYSGKTYRGVSCTRDDLNQYVVGSKILNKSFQSTSKDREVAERFGQLGKRDELNPKSDVPSTDLSILYVYVIKTRITALDIETLSHVGFSEREVLILPFSPFQVTRIQRISECVVELTLEELVDVELDL